jgi:hypothetical protein
MKFRIILRFIAVMTFSLATLLMAILVLSGGAIQDYWTALWKPESEVKKIAEQAYTLYIINFFTLVVLEIFYKDDKKN